MNKQGTRVNPVEKDRIREEIEAQVQEYLQRGGKIDVLTANQRQQLNTIGSVWDIEFAPDMER